MTGVGVFFCGYSLKGCRTHKAGVARLLKSWAGTREQLELSTGISGELRIVEIYLLLEKLLMKTAAVRLIDRRVTNVLKHFWIDRRIF
jgi:hypothetical protein